MFVLFLNKLQETNEVLEQPIVVCSLIDGLRNKQHFFETSAVDKVRRHNIPHHWLLRDLARTNAFQHTFLPL